MKRLFFALLVVCLLPAVAFSANTVTQTALEIDTHMRTLTLAVFSDGTDFTVATNTANTAYIKGWYLYSVTAYATGAAFTPDAADVLIYDSVGNYLLGSEDAGTTAYKGLNLIQSSGTYSCIPDMYIKRAGEHQPFFWPIRSALTVAIKNQGTASAYFNIVLTFVK